MEEPKLTELRRAIAAIRADTSLAPREADRRVQVRERERLREKGYMY